MAEIPNGYERIRHHSEECDCEHCGFPDENRHTFTLIEIKSYLQSMFKRANCGDQAAGGIEENNRLACAFNLLLDEHEGIAKHCDDDHHTCDLSH